MPSSQQGSQHGSQKEEVHPHLPSDNSITNQPDLVNILSDLKKVIGDLSSRLATVESKQDKPRTPPIVLGTQFEVGGTSRPHTQLPLPSQEVRHGSISPHLRPGPIRVPTRPIVSPLPRPPPMNYPREFSNPNSPDLNRYSDYDVDEFQGDRYMRQGGRGRRPRFQRHEQRYDQAPRPREEDGIGKVKVKIPSFEGKCDPDLYLVWVRKMDQIWACHNFPEMKKIQVATLEFQDYAMLWWDSFTQRRRDLYEPPITTWVDMKRHMRERFVPDHYKRELRYKLESLKQGSMSVEEVYNAMHMAMIKADIRETSVDTNARFLRVLNPSISLEVDMYPYDTSDQLLHNAIKVERKMKQRLLQTARPTSRPTTQGNTWNGRPSSSTPF